MSTTNIINILDGGVSSSTNYIDVYDNGEASTEESFFTEKINGRSSENRIKERLSAIVSEQFPEFIQSEYRTFISFIEAYYKYLEKDYEALEIIQNAKSLSDINETADGFVQYFLNVYAINVPENTLIDDRLLVKKITQLYEAKGSSISFDILFRLLFNESSVVNYPFDNILRASAGIWEQTASLRVRYSGYEPSVVLNRILTYTNNNVVYKTPVVSYKILEEDLIEIFVNVNEAAPLYNVGDSVFIYNDLNQTLFTGILEPTLVNVNIIKRGLNFKVGQIFTVLEPTTNSQQSVFKVKRVDENGSILSLEILTFGYNFSGSTFNTFLSPTGVVSFDLSGFDSLTFGFSESVIIGLVDPLSPSRYFLEEYAESNTYTYSTTISATTESTYNETIIEKNIPSDFAEIELEIGALSVYPGGYTTNEGFLSESEIRIEDDLLYQPFAYQVESNIDISKFYDIVTSLIHPAGQRLFSSRVISNLVDLSTSVEVIPLSNVTIEATSSYSVIEENELHVNKVLEDDVNLSNDIVEVNVSLSYSSNIDEILSLTSTLLNKPELDNVDVDDSPSKVININVEDSTISIDSFPTINIQLFENDVISLLRDRGNVALDDGTFFFFSDGEEFNIFEFDNITFVDEPLNTVQKLINIDEDDPQIVDFGSFTLNDFVDGHYFENDYVGIQAQIN